MDGVLYAPPQWEHGEDQAHHPSTETHPAPTNRPPTGPIRRYRRRRHNNQNPYPPVVIIADEDDHGNGDTRNFHASTTTVMQTRVELKRFRHQKPYQHRRRSSDEGGQGRQRGGEAES